MDQVNYKFGEDSTAEEVLSNVDLCGRLVALTGATAGIGIATAQALAAAGADLVIGARNPVKLESLFGRASGPRRNGVAAWPSARPDVI